MHELCSGADGLTLNTTFRSHEGTRSCYRIDVPSAGILTLDASAPGSPEAEPRLVFLGNGPERVPGTVPQVLVRETPRGVIVAVDDSGTFLVIVAPEDPALPLAGYKLRTAFVSRVPTKKVDEEDDDDDIEALCNGPLKGSGTYGVGEFDDHGDTPLCATPLELGASATGTIENAAGDDEDFFTFVVDELRSVQIDATAGHLTLYDGKGQRLASSVEGAEALRLVRALSPGRYYLRLQSVWGSGDTYVLSLGALDEP